MRKYFLLRTFVMSIFLLMCSSVSDASIMKAYDNEDGSAILYSKTKLQNQAWENIGFWKSLQLNAPYHLELTTHGYKEWIFFQGQVSILIKDVWYDLDAGEQKTKNDWPNVITTAQYALPQPVAEHLVSLKNADKVELRLHFQNKTYVQWSIPDRILVEWQELIQRTR